MATIYARQYVPSSEGTGGKRWGTGRMQMCAGRTGLLGVASVVGVISYACERVAAAVAYAAKRPSG